MTRRTLLGSVAAVTMFPQPAAGVYSQAPQATTPGMQIGLRLGEPESRLHGWRRALVLAGMVEGSLMQGTVQSGQLEWLVDPASGAVEVAIDMLLVRADGALIRLRDRSAPADDAAQRASPGLSTAPELFDAAGTLLAPARLAGHLDVSGLGRGVVWLRAFDRARTA
jgi:hypothetical protein